ncbi:MAG: ion transporter [Myxococcales bacterium FL481]|nr:MAG: ion transporter [Myxococcales bacterium FL481]
MALLGLILLSVLLVSLETVTGLAAHRDLFMTLEWVVTGVFLIEYILRLVAVEQPRRYAWSFLGVVDLLAIAPTFLGLVFVDAHSLTVIRALRLLRVFRVFKLGRYLREAHVLTQAISAARHKIFVFLLGVGTLVLLLGTVMYVVEGPIHGFTSIPKSVYWAIVTMTTVGYGDIAPQTPFGQGLAAFVMLLGYGVLAVPTGIVSVELAKVSDPPVGSTGAPPVAIRCACGFVETDPAARFCRRCGARLSSPKSE